jgi:hypothetical protein
MSGRTTFAFLLLIVAAAGTATPSQAEILKFHVNLDGKYGAATGSPATGRAAVLVNTATKRVSVDLNVDGITTDQLWTNLVQRPIGPIHFHKYDGAGGAVLALPLPYGATYHPTKSGIHVVMDDFDYASDAALVKTSASFDEFVADMKNGSIVLNVHTNKFNAGEISGLVVPD